MGEEFSRIYANFLRDPLALLPGHGGSSPSPRRRLSPPRLWWRPSSSMMAIFAFGAWMRIW